MLAQLVLQENMQILVPQLARIVRVVLMLLVEARVFVLPALRGLTRLAMLSLAMLAPLANTPIQMLLLVLHAPVDPTVQMVGLSAVCHVLRVKFHTLVPRVARVVQQVRIAILLEKHA